MVQSQPGRELDGSLDTFDCHFIPAALMLDQTEQVPRVCIAGVDSKHLPVDSLGLREVASLLMLQAQLD